MKQFFTLFMTLIAVVAVKAQSDFPLQFTDKEGQVIADGSVLSFTDYEIDAFGDIQIPINLWVKNVSDAPVQGGGQYAILSISNGAFETCFPKNCIRQTAPGTYSTGNDNFAPGESRNMMTEWFLTAEGTCQVTYQLQTYRKMGTNQWMLDGDGPIITLDFSYGTTAVHNNQVQNSIMSEAYYDLQGQLVAAPVHGLYIKRTVYNDGSHKTKITVIR